MRHAGMRASGPRAPSSAPKPRAPCGPGAWGWILALAASLLLVLSDLLGGCVPVAQGGVPRVEVYTSHLTRALVSQLSCRAAIQPEERRGQEAISSRSMQSCPGSRDWIPSAYPERTSTRTTRMLLRHSLQARRRPLYSIGIHRSLRR